MALASWRRCRAIIQLVPTESPARSATRPTTSVGAQRRNLPLRTGEEPVGPGVRDERLRQYHRPVPLLPILEDRDQGPREGEPRRIERMHELRLRRRLGTEPKVGAPRLEIGEAARARHFEPLPH